MVRLSFGTACAVVLGVSSGAGAASFNCAKAKSKIEKAVCSDPKLSQFDEDLNRYYTTALDALKDGASCLKSDERAWVKAVRDKCGPKADCLSNGYLGRLATLDSLQPGMSAIKYVELPTAPSLIAAIPPETEPVPSHSKKTFEMSGHLVHEASDKNNMGYAVKPAKGAARAFVYDMSIGNSANHQIVADAIAQEPTSRFMVRGTLADDGGFADDKCRFVYRLP
jgi:uncharacterized protein